METSSPLNGASSPVYFAASELRLESKLDPTWADFRLRMTVESDD
jgi:hypothetical protein